MYGKHARQGDLSDFLTFTPLAPLADMTFHKTITSVSCTAISFHIPGQLCPN